MIEWVSQWVNDWLNEWVSEWMIDWMSESVSEWLSDWVFELLNVWFAENVHGKDLEKHFCLRSVFSSSRFTFHSVTAVSYQRQAAFLSPGTIVHKKPSAFAKNNSRYPEINPMENSWSKKFLGFQPASMSFCCPPLWTFSLPFNTVYRLTCYICYSMQRDVLCHIKFLR